MCSAWLLVEVCWEFLSDDGPLIELDELTMSVVCCRVRE